MTLPFTFPIQPQAWCPMIATTSIPPRKCGTSQAGPSGPALGAFPRLRQRGYWNRGSKGSIQPHYNTHPLRTLADQGGEGFGGPWQQQYTMRSQHVQGTAEVQLISE